MGKKNWLHPFHKKCTYYVKASFNPLKYFHKSAPKTQSSKNEQQ